MFGLSGRGWKRRESESFSLLKKKRKKKKKGEAKGERNQILLAYINGEKLRMLTFLKNYIF